MFRQLEPRTVAQHLRERPNATVLLDVREPYERRLAAIVPSLHIPMNEVPERIEEIPKDREVVVYCHVGERSIMVAAYLEANGFPSVTNLSGGIDAWSVLVDRSVPRYP